MKSLTLRFDTMRQEASTKNLTLVTSEIFAKWTKVKFISPVIDSSENIDFE